MHNFCDISKQEHIILFQKEPNVNVTRIYPKMVCTALEEIIHSTPFPTYKQCTFPSSTMGLMS